MAGLRGDPPPGGPLRRVPRHGSGRRILFQKVPEPKAGKNRVHLDLLVGGERHRAEVERVVALGAAIVREADEPMGRWTIMADPEENEFCVG